MVPDQRRFKLKVAVLTMATAVSAAAGAEMAFPLVTAGKPIAKVLVAGENKLVSESVADLALYVKKISGAELEISQGTEDLPGPTLHVGQTSLFDRTAAARERIIVDGFVMAKVGEDLIVSGNLPQGTSNGIYTILQSKFGVRWYYPGELWEHVPTTSSLTIHYDANAPANARVENPSFMERSLWGGGGNSPFGRRVRLTVKGTPLPYVGAGHALGHVVNPKKFPDKPEYFAYWDGERHVSGDVHACYTHPDMVEIFMDYIREGGNNFGVIDNLTACKCERCLAVDGVSEPYLGMWNFSESFFQLMQKVAAQAAKEFPDRRLGAFAYQLTNAPPKTVEHIGDNVDIVLCQDTAQHFDAELKAMDQAMAAEWVKKCGHVRFYGYVGINYWTPRYFPHILADQLKHLHKVGVVGYGTHSTSMPDSSMPLYHLLYQMLWDADLDPDAVIDEMITNLYGEAAEPIRQYYDHWEQCWNGQTKGRWFWGMDNFRGEMGIYSWEDIARGLELLDEAANLPRDEKVIARIAFLRESFAFTYASARAHVISMNAIKWDPAGRNYEEAVLHSNLVADAWRDWVGTFERARQEVGVGRMWGWLSKTWRVRAWGLKQQMRDAALAPLVRWACENEGRQNPRAYRIIERGLAGTAILNRDLIEDKMTDEIGAAYRKPQANGLRVADATYVTEPIELKTDSRDWEGIDHIDQVPWVFHLRPDEPKIGRYEEPMKQFYVDPPKQEDQSMRWQAAWDEQNLYLRIVVRDNKHVQNQPATTMWKEDSLQIGFNPERDNFIYDAASWDYIWGGYKRDEAEIGVSLHEEEPRAYVFHPGAVGEADKALSLITAKARRHGDNTIYEVVIDWQFLPTFEPKPEHSLGICVVVNDVDEGQRRSATYGSGVIHAKRPTEFAAIRLRKE